MHVEEDLKFDDALNRAINVDEMQLYSQRESTRLSKFDENKPVGQFNVNWNRTADANGGAAKMANYNKTADVISTIKNAVDKIDQLPLATEGSEIGR